MISGEVCGLHLSPCILSARIYMEVSGDSNRGVITDEKGAIPTWYRFSAKEHTDKQDKQDKEELFNGPDGLDLIHLLAQAFLL